MKAKLEYLMSQTGLRSGQIAKMLDVKPSVISHLLIGRNQPNYKLTAKIIELFPDYSPLWWLGITDDPHANVTPTVATPKSEVAGGGHTVTTPSFSEQSLFDVNPQRATAPKMQSSQLAEANIAAVADSSEVERVIVIYKDKSFESFTPKK
ncbi:MAG: helix-turn-helix transcriptional regulator [Alistipes sp.]|nr:helix-turn-helix transcriptional regulator [Alistipes sp.]